MVSRKSSPYHVIHQYFFFHIVLDGVSKLSSHKDSGYKTKLEIILVRLKFV